MGKITAGLVLFFLFLAYYMFVPEVVCTVTWVDSENHQIDGPFDTCKMGIKKRHIGALEFAKIGNAVYRVTKIYGGGMLPSKGIRRQRADNILFIKLDGSPDLDKLRDYYGGRYLSDGKVILNMNGRRMLQLTPPLRIANLEPVPGAPGMEGYATDGHWVIFYNEVVKGADASTFKQVFAHESDGTEASPGGHLQFGCDRNSVFHGSRRLDGADPKSFGLISYNLGRDPPPGIPFSSDEVERGSGWVVIDRSHVWETDYFGVRALEVTHAQFGTLQRDLQKANNAAHISSNCKPDGENHDLKPRA